MSLAFVNEVIHSRSTSTWNLRKSAQRSKLSRFGPRAEREVSEDRLPLVNLLEMEAWMMWGFGEELI